MTEQVDFYVLAGADRAGKLRFACRIAQKAYHNGLKVYLYTPDAMTSTELDELLWTFAQGSFIPHCIAGQESADWDDYPVQLGSAPEAVETGDLLVNLADEISEHHQRFVRIADLVAGNDDEKSSGRNRFRHYRQLGIEPNTHQMT